MNERHRILMKFDNDLAKQIGDQILNNLSTHISNQDYFLVQLGRFVLNEMRGDNS
jgi:hypothetical protein